MLAPAPTLDGLTLSSCSGVVLSRTWLMALLGVALSCAGTTHRRRPLKTTTQDDVADRVLPGSKVRMIVSLGADGAELRFVTEQVCVSETKRTTTDVGAEVTETVDRQHLPCNRRQLAGADIIVKDIRGVTLQTGTTTSGGAWRLNWGDLTPLQLRAFSNGPALVEVVGKGTVGTLVLGPAEAARAMIEKAKGLAADDKVDEAEDAAKMGEELGADATAARAAIVSRREFDADMAGQARAEEDKQARIQEHLASAKQAIKEDDPQTAKSELDQAEALGGYVALLRDAAEATPKGRRLAREAERAKNEQERQRAEQERQQEANARREAERVQKQEERKQMSTGLTSSGQSVTKARACARPLGGGNRSEAFGIAELFLHGDLDRLQEAETISAAGFVLKSSGNQSNWPIIHLLNTLPASAIAEAATGRLTKTTRDMFAAVGFVPNNTLILEAILQYRLTVYQIMVGRTMALSGWKGDVAGDRFETRLVESADSITAYSYALASEYNLPPKVVLRAISLTVCGR
jgi:hypothetical protein